MSFEFIRLLANSVKIINYGHGSSTPPTYESSFTVTVTCPGSRFNTKGYEAADRVCAIILAALMSQVLQAILGHRKLHNIT